MPDERISLSEASRRSGVSASTLKRWAEEKVVPVRRGRWTATAAAHARVVARMRDRGHSLEEIAERRPRGPARLRLRRGARFRRRGAATAASRRPRRPDLEPALIERILGMLGSPEPERARAQEDARAAACAPRARRRLPARGVPPADARLRPGACAQIADAEVRLFHLYVHEPLMREGVPGLEVAEQMGELAARLLPLSSPVMDHLHRRFLHHFVEQDIVGHMEARPRARRATSSGQCARRSRFADLAGYTRSPSSRATRRRRASSSASSPT